MRGRELNGEKSCSCSLLVVVKDRSGDEHEHESRTRFRAYKFYARRRALLLQKLQNFLWMSFRVLNRRPVTQNFAVGTDHDGRANGSFYSLTFGVFPLSPRAVGPHDFDLWIR